MFSLLSGRAIFGTERQNNIRVGTPCVLSKLLGVVFRYIGIRPLLRTHRLLTAFLTSLIPALS